MSRGSERNSLPARRSQTSTSSLAAQPQVLSFSSTIGQQPKTESEQLALIEASYDGDLFVDDGRKFLARGTPAVLRRPEAHWR
jgi:hypothetical protein